MENVKRGGNSGSRCFHYKGRNASTKDAISDLLQEYYSDLATPDYTSTQFDDDFKSTIESEVVTYESNIINRISEIESDVTTDEISNILKQLKRGKSPGPDGINNEHLIHSGNVIIKSICRLFNCIIEAGYVPLSYRIGSIISIYKNNGKDKRDPSNYRGITLTSVLGKLLEKIILKRIESSIENQSITFPNNLQFGFRGEYGSIVAAFSLREAIKLKFFIHSTDHYYICRGSPVYAAFLDNEKAFDRIWHEGLLYKLYHLGISDNIWKLISFWYRNNYAYVSYMGSDSNVFKVSQGVGQGRVLSAFMFLVYINDLINELCNFNTGLKIGTLEILQY